jgi:hypothetical protein
MNRASLVWTLLACSALGAVTAAADLADDSPAEKAANSKQFHELLLEIAKSYQSVGPVDFDGRWSPVYCRAPQPYVDYTPATARLSASKDSETHGRKLYFLFAKDRTSYLALEKETAEKATQIKVEESVGSRSLPSKPLPEKLKATVQFVVKESWTPEEISEKERVPAKPFDRTVPYATKDGKTYKAGKQGALFIMCKLDPKTPETDNGWVYGTVTADAKQVTSAGRVDSCVRCHKEAKHDRLFGLARPEVVDKSAKSEK